MESFLYEEMHQRKRAAALVHMRLKYRAKYRRIRATMTKPSLILTNLAPHVYREILKYF